MSNALHQYLEKSVTEAVHNAISEMAYNIQRRHQNVQAILAYGSALRDSNPENTLMDFYVLTQDYDGVSANALSAHLCKLIPPNVYYIEATVQGALYRCKYAVLPMEHLAQKVRATTANPYFWVRFAQPMRLVWSVDALAKTRVLQILMRAMETAVAHARELSPQAPWREQWIELFRNTYQTELRPEDASRAVMIVDVQSEHFQMISQHANLLTAAAMPWSLRRWQGKALSVLRLLKAAFTFQGGADYAAWKIKRHSGVDIEIKDWHRRHPIIASLTLLPKLLRKGGLK